MTSIVRIGQVVIILAMFATCPSVDAATAVPTDWVSTSTNFAYGNLNCIGVTATSAGARIDQVETGRLNLPVFDPGLPPEAEALGGADWDAWGHN